jgi:hypothetical protein
MKLQRGTVVQFRNPTEEEKNLFFQVIEDREEVVLVNPLMISFQDWEVRPSFVYLKTDLEPVAAPAKRK